jgi:SAM-dependent methyltransferase
VTYRVASESESGLPDRSVDLVTVAQALHWFNMPRFFDEARRVLKPGGVVAVWCYTRHRLGNPFDAVLDRFYSETVGPYWPPEREIVEAGYRTIPFPFDDLAPPNCVMEQQLTLDGLLNYQSTWSATKRFEQARGFTPIPALKQDLLPLWGDPEQPRRVTWPLKIRIGRYLPA